jgi:hypothetical protein
MSSFAVVTEDSGAYSRGKILNVQQMEEHVVYSRWKILACTADEGL